MPKILDNKQKTVAYPRYADGIFQRTSIERLSSNYREAIERGSVLGQSLRRCAAVQAARQAAPAYGSLPWRTHGGVGRRGGGPNRHMGRATPRGGAGGAVPWLGCQALRAHGRGGGQKGARPPEPGRPSPAAAPAASEAAAQPAEDRPRLHSDQPSWRAAAAELAAALPPLPWEAARETCDAVAAAARGLA